MKYKFPLYFLALTAAFACSFANDTYAQQDVAQFGPSQAFLDDLSELENQDFFIVSGITAEETVISTFGDDLTLRGDRAVQLVAEDTPFLTLPTGRVFRNNADDGYKAGEIFSVVSPIRSEPFEFIAEGSRLEVDPTLGRVVGVEVQAALNTVIFDGDTLLAFRAIRFFPGPDENVTTIAFEPFGAEQISIAFATGTGTVPELSAQEETESIADKVRELADATTDPLQGRLLDIATFGLGLAARDFLYEEGGERLSNFGSVVFAGSGLAIRFLERSDVEGTDELTDSILANLKGIADDEIAFAIENGGRASFIARAMDFAARAENESDPVFAARFYRLAWVFSNRSTR